MLSMSPAPDQLPVRTDVFQRLLGKEVEIRYRDKNGAETTRVIVPKCGRSEHGHPVVCAFCKLRNAERDFTLSRIASVRFDGWAALVAEQDEMERSRARVALSQARNFCAMAVVLLLLSFSACAVARMNMTPASVSVSGYTRSDGTRVGSYSRRPPGSRSHDRLYELLSVIGFFGVLGGGYCLLSSWENFKSAKRRL